MRACRTRFHRRLPMLAATAFAAMAFVVTAFAAAALAAFLSPAEAREIQMLCKHEMAEKPVLWVFDTDNRTWFSDDGKRREATVSVNESEIRMKQIEVQPICHVGAVSSCTSGKSITEYTTVINRRAGTYLVYCKAIQDDAHYWKPGQNCFPQGPNKGVCNKN